MIYRYFSILLASMLLLAGLQVPSFVDQYEKRVDAHLTEVTQNLRGFQEIADKYYNGSIEALIEKHEASADLTFKLEAKPIGAMYKRYKIFKREKERLDTNLFNQVRYIALQGDETLLRETVNTYTYTITLNEESALSGAIALIVGLLTADLVKGGVSAGVRRRRRRRENAHIS